jgi:molybdopterin synthase sulfur carrier subunit
MEREVLAGIGERGYIARMQLKILAFAQAQDQLGFRERVVECNAGDSPRTILAGLAPDFDASGLRVAVDCEYHEWDAPVGAATELALIPPVSGG